MRHRLKSKLYGYKQGPRKALIRSLVYSLIENGRIQTSLVRAKEARRHIEQALTQAKKNTLHSRRILLSRFPNKKVILTLVEKIVPNFKERKGGYTRITKTADRKGDASKMAFLEFVEYDQKTYKEKYFPIQKEKKVAFQSKKKVNKKEKDQKSEKEKSKSSDPITKKA